MCRWIDAVTAEREEPGGATCVVDGLWGVGGLEVDDRDVHDCSVRW